MKKNTKTKPKEDKGVRVKKCAQEIDAVLKRYNCGIKAIVVFQELGPIIYDKQVYTLD